MKTFFYSTFIVCLSAILFSCSNEIEELEIEEEIEVTELPSEIHFFYKGKEYFSVCENKDDELFIVDDEVRALMEELKQKPNLATFVDEEDKLVYYDNIQVLKEELGINENLLTEETSSTRAYNNIVEFKLWLNENINQKKGMGDYFLTPANPSVRVGNMGSKNDKLSSLHLRLVYQSQNTKTNYIRGYVTLYEHEKLGGSSITFNIVAAQTDVMINNLKNYQMVFGSGNWNDKTSSFEAYLTTILPHYLYLP